MACRLFSTKPLSGILLVGLLGTNVSEILIEILIFQFKKIRLKLRHRNVDHLSLTQCDDGYVLEKPRIVPFIWTSRHIWSTHRGRVTHGRTNNVNHHGPLTRYAKLWVAPLTINCIAQRQGNWRPSILVFSIIRNLIYDLVHIIKNARVVLCAFPLEK